MSAVGERVARGRASWKVRVVTYAGVGGYVAAALVGVASAGDRGAVVAAALMFGAIMFWLGRRSSLESASAEAMSWAVATAQASATSSALAGVQVNLDLGKGLVRLTDPTGLHERVIDVDHSGAGYPIASSMPVERGVSSPLSAPKVLDAGAVSTFPDLSQILGLDRSRGPATMGARVGGADSDSPGGGGVRTQ